LLPKVSNPFIIGFGSSLTKVLAVNNYPTAERFERLRSCIIENGIDVITTNWNESLVAKFNDFEGVILSGSPDMMSRKDTQEKFRREAEAVLDARVPILGVCFGHQLIAHAFGSSVVADAENVLRFVKTAILLDDPLFSGLPREVSLLESRHEIVKALPEEFEKLAASETSPIAAMRHRKRTLYGVQFHPERYTAGSPAGKFVVRNFLGLLQ